MPHFQRRDGDSPSEGEAGRREREVGERGESSGGRRCQQLRSQREAARCPRTAARLRVAQMRVFCVRWSWWAEELTRRGKNEFPEIFFFFFKYKKLLQASTSNLLRSPGQLPLCLQPPVRNQHLARGCGPLWHHKGTASRSKGKGGGPRRPAGDSVSVVDFIQFGKKLSCFNWDHR